MMRSGSSETNEAIQWIVSSGECPKRKREAVKGLRL
jgi:hypothetical protein